MFIENILETIGNTPIVRLGLWRDEIKADVGLKLEAFNPGLSIKDRMALYMVNQAMASGRLLPGGVLVEASSGNTGYGVAMVGAVYGFPCIITLPDKASEAKVSALRALGAEVVICPSQVAPHHPDSYYQRAAAIAEATPGAVYINQYFNPANAEAHYFSTGPEIWRQTRGAITHLVAPVGTGGSLSGTARYLRERNPKLCVIGVDAYGSVLKKYHETGKFDESEIYPYYTEGLGKNMIPGNVDFDIIDEFVKVSDADGAETARLLARKTGILAGHSSGAAVFALRKISRRLRPNHVVVVLLHDHGSKYLQKIYNDDWLAEKGLLPGQRETPAVNGRLVHS